MNETEVGSILLFCGVVYYFIMLGLANMFFPKKPKESKPTNPYWQSQGKTYSPEEMEAAFTKAYNDCSKPGDSNGK